MEEQEHLDPSLIFARCPTPNLRDVFGPSYKGAGGSWGGRSPVKWGKKTQRHPPSLLVSQVVSALGGPFCILNLPFSTLKATMEWQWLFLSKWGAAIVSAKKDLCTWCNLLVIIISSIIQVAYLPSNAIYTSTVIKKLKPHTKYTKSFSIQMN